MLIAGAAGSVLHCVPMCGPFVLGAVSDRLACVPVAGLCEAQRFRSGLWLPYHFGRLCTYSGLGAAVGLAGGALTRLPWFTRAGGVLLLVAAFLFLAEALRRVLPRLPFRLPSTTPGTLPIGRLAARIDRSRPGAGFLVGAILGFLPCGFLYAALTAAAAAGTPLGGAIDMLAFGLGTVPSLMVVGVAGHTAGRRWQGAISAATPVILAANALFLTILAFGMLRGE